MNKRSDAGGVTALVIALTLIVVFVGVAFFFWIQIIGGGKELQHAIDAGNLNVAKQVLKSPDITLSDPVKEVAEFQGLLDPGSKVNLLNFNRLVAKTVLVTLNAADLGTEEAKAHARQLAELLEGEGGIGARLAAQLSKHDELKGHFSLLSSPNSTRMLRNDGSIRDEASETNSSFMARRKAANVFFKTEQVPASVAAFLADANNIVEKVANGSRKKYLSGYNNINLSLPGVVLQGVPLRPGEQPHLVSVDDFGSNAGSPLGSGGASRIPPNSFQSGGKGKESSSGADILTRSCAIVGTLNMEFGASIPSGYIEIDNGESFPKIDFNGNVGGGEDIFTTLMMQPEHLDLVTGGPKAPYIGKTDKVQAVIDYVEAHKSDTPRPQVPNNLLSGIDSPTNLSSDEAYGLVGQTVHRCTNKNSISGGPGPSDASCVANVSRFQEIYGSTTGAHSVTANDLMAVEAFKCFVLQVRAAVDSDGCGSAVAPGQCSGLKHFNLNASYPPGPGAPYPAFSAPCVMSAEGSLDELLLDSNAPNTVRRDLTVRMHQIKPDATDSEIESVFSSKVPFRKTSYIYLDPSTKTLVLSAVKPNPLTNIDPDGNKVGFTTGEVDLNGRIVNVPGEEGYPNPWDCPPPQPGTAHNEGQWWPGTGFHNLLGKLRFRNCASGGGNWCCPC